MMSNINHNIIAFGGRKESGKTELAKICERYGYTKISFATPLKMLICKLLKLDDIKALNELKNKEIGHALTEDDYQILSDACGAPIDVCEELTAELNEHSTGRDWLQIIGTDLIRTYDYNWHAEQTIKLIEPDKKYVIDDIRFPNELNMLKQLNAECWYVIRTKVDNISHHSSEESITFTDFDNNVIANDGVLAKMAIRWDIYMNTHIETYAHRRRLIDNLPKVVGAEVYFVYPEMKNLNTQVSSVRHTMEIHQIRPNFENNGFIVSLDGVDMWEEKNPFRIEVMKEYYKEED